MPTKSPRKLRKLVIDRVDLVPRGANPVSHIVLFKNKNSAPVEKQDGMPPMTLEERQRPRQLYQLWADFCDTMYALMNTGNDPATMQVILTSITQFHDQAQALMESLGLLAKVAPHLAMSTQKGTTMSAWDEIEREARLKVESGAVSTREQGVVAVVKERPDLRQRYYAEPRPVVVAKATPPVAKHWSLERLEAMAQELRHTSREPLTKEAALVRVMKSDAGRRLAQAYREHQRERARA